jgi:NAD(P)-dependent dehydrogenase (short-subunit alcohol dehydrogenase family)
MTIDLSGKHALVTGASRGIGRAIARHLALAGAGVGAHYARGEEGVGRLTAEFGTRVLPFQADLSEPKSANRLFAEVLKVFGRLDILVNNAGIALGAAMEDPEEKWLEAWEKTMAVNLTAAGLLCRLAVNHFARNGGGRIINIASRAAFRGDVPEYAAYAASKGGMVALTRTIARGFGKQNIQAFVIAPGFARTDMAQQFIDRFGEDQVLRDIALDRLTEPDDIAPTVVFLASGLADHASGGTFDINAASYVH